MFKNLTDEIKWLQKRIELNPQSVLFARLAERYLQMDEYDQAIDICNTGLDEHPEYTNAHLVLAKCYMRKNDFEQADQEFRKLLSIQGNHLTAHKLYGDLMTHTGWANSAETSYEKILEIDPLETHMKEPLENFAFDVQRSAEPGVNIEPVSDDIIGANEQESVDEMFGASAQDSDETIDSLFGDQEESFADTELDPSVAEEIKDTDPEEYRLADETVEALFENEHQQSTEQQDGSFDVFGGDDSGSDFADTLISDEAQEDDIFGQANDTETSIETETEYNFGQQPDQVEQPLIDDEPESEPVIDTELAADSETDFSFNETDEQDDFGFDNIQPSTDDIFGGAQEDNIFPATAADEDMQLFATESETETGPATPATLTEESSEFTQSFPEPGIQETPSVEQPEPEQKDWSTNVQDTLDDVEPKVASDSLRQEKDKYSDILDGIFSQDVEEEERKESETRDKLEQVISEAEETTELDESYNFDEMQIDNDLAGSAFFDTDVEGDDDDTSPEDLLMSKAEEAEVIPEQEFPDAQGEEPHIPDGFMAFEEDDTQESLETETVHAQDAEDLDDDEEKFSDFLAGLGDPKEFKDEVITEFEQETATPKPDDMEGPDDKPSAEFISAPEPHDSNQDDIADTAPATETDADEKPKEKFVTPTLGEIYAAQGQYAKAINVFEMLLEKNPDNEWYQSKLEYLRKKLEENE